MVSEALAVLDDAPVEQHYALFSGGHDSLCATWVAAQHPLFRGVIHLNTGIGIEQTREFVRETCAQQSWPLIEIQAPEGRYDQLVLERGGFPYGVLSHNVMLFYLKQQPLERWFRNTDGPVGLVTGIRRAESERRMGAGISTPVRRWRRRYWVSPLLDWSKIDCNRLIESEGLSRNPVVDLLHRSGECLCGALARHGEIREIARWYPEAALRINKLERECEERGIVANVWAGFQARKLAEGQMQLFSKAALAPLCTSCEASAV